MKIECSALTDVGSVRANNEDAVLVNASCGLAIVADGMGGYKAGEVASRMAVEGIESELGQWLEAADAKMPSTAVMRAMQAAVDSTNRAIFEAANTHAEWAGMGTTLVLAVLRGHRVHIGHVGDSRAYHFHRGVLRQITRDHSLLQEQLDAGLITREDAVHSGYRGLITRALGVEDTVLLDTEKLELAAGDAILLCSDGLTDMLSDTEIAAVISTDDPIDVQTSQLIDAANARGGLDNVSAILLRVVKEQKRAVAA